MGRPRVEEQNKRIVQVNIRLTEEEHKKITQYSQASGLSPANWIRRKVFTAKFPPVKLSPLDAAIYRELKAMGINLNQIAHKIVKYGKLPDSAQTDRLFIFSPSFTAGIFKHAIGLSERETEGVVNSIFEIPKVLSLATLLDSNPGRHHFIDRTSLLWATYL